MEPSGSLQAADRRTPSGIGSGLLALSRNSMVLKIISSVAEVFEVVDLVLAGPVGFVARLARRVGVFDRGAVHQMLTAAPAIDRGPEIVEHVAMEADPLAGLAAG